MVVTAPPGSGKTVLLRSWLTEAGLAERAAWVPVGRDDQDPVPLENAIRSGDLRILGGSGGVRVFVDQAAQDGSSVDPSGIDFGHSGVWGVTMCVGDVLSNALVRPGRL